MSSPFSSFELSTLTFRLGGGTPTLDETGNFAAPGKTLEVKAFLSPKNRQGRDQVIPGEVLNQAEVEGRFVEPFKRPPELLAGMRADAVVNGVQGSFVLGLSLPDPLGVAEQLGDPIAGTFSVTANRGSFSGTN